MNQSIRKIVIIGPAHPLRGGLASFDQRLCKEFSKQGFEASIYSFSLQYPSFLFPGTTQFSTDPAPENMQIFSCINSVNPLNWLKTGLKLKKEKPDLIVVRYWLPFMGPALGTIVRIASLNKHTHIVAITDNVLPHEKRPGDRMFTRYFLKSCHAFVTMSEKVLGDLKSFEPTKPAKQVLHPLYDNFGSAVPIGEARKKLGIEADVILLLFFGFIRKYKGLDLLLEAMNILKSNGVLSSSNIKLMIAGEYYEDTQKYEELIRQYQLEEYLILKTDFIPDQEVRYYLCASNLVVQPYRNATQSGVTPLSYHFEKPMVVTNVGGLPQMVPHGKAGLVCEPNPTSIANAIQEFVRLGEKHFLPHLRTEKEKYSWEILAEALIGMAVSKGK